MKLENDSSSESAVFWVEGTWACESNRELNRLRASRVTNLG